MIFVAFLFQLSLLSFLCRLFCPFFSIHFPCHFFACRFFFSICFGMVKHHSFSEHCLFLSFAELFCQKLRNRSDKSQQMIKTTIFSLNVNTFLVFFKFRTFWQISPKWKKTTKSHSNFKKMTIKMKPFNMTNKMTKTWQYIYFCISNVCLPKILLKFSKLWDLYLRFRWKLHS